MINRDASLRSRPNLKLNLWSFFAPFSQGGLRESSYIDAITDNISSYVQGGAKVREHRTIAASTSSLLAPL